MSFIAAAIIGGVASIGGALISSKASRKAADASLQAARENNALQAQIFGQNQANAQPYLQRGNEAATQLQALLNLSGDQQAARSAFDQFLGSTNYQFQFDQGQRAITGNRASAGLLDSGSTGKALVGYGQQMGRNALEGYLNRLFDISGQGSNAVSALAGVGQNYANAVSANNNSAADARGNAALASGSAWNNAFGQIGQLAGYVYGAKGFGQSSFPTTGHGHPGAYEAPPFTVTAPPRGF